ncbi:MAG: glycogen synthase, partial [Bryobacteraceae bacterium]
MSKILMIASEATPFSKTGGLADVIGALPAALQARGDEVAVVLPLYRESAGFLEGAERVYNDLYVWLGLKNFQTHIRKVEQEGVLFYFVDCPSLFDREFLYGPPGGDYPDNHVRFAVFCQAALGVIRYLFRPDVIHCHDWQAALTAPIIRCQYAGDPTFYGLKLLLTIHNLGYQGIFAREALAELGLNPSLFHPDRLEFWGNINLLKGGITYSDAISTVSKGYAREIQEPELGFGLDGLLRSRADVLAGIVNGVDYNEWSPANDRFIRERFGAGNLAGKRACKRDLLEAFGLPADNLDRPLAATVSRFVSQKGFDLIQEVADALAAEDLSLIVLGSGEERYERMFLDLAAAHPDRIA